jgi:hypothetical protein
VAEKHPIPRSQDLIIGLEGAKSYYTLNMAQDYSQVPIKQEDQNNLLQILDYLILKEFRKDIKI